MKKVKVQELEIGKIYKAIYEDVEQNGIFKINDVNKLMIKDDTRWVQIGVSYNTVLDIEFIEIKKEIDWTKVPRGTKVQVKYCEDRKWENRYFVKCKLNTKCPFEVSEIKDDDFIKLKMEHISSIWECCRIHPSVEIPNEWYKEE